MSPKFRRWYLASCCYFEVSPVWQNFVKFHCCYCSRSWQTVERDAFNLSTAPKLICQILFPRIQFCSDFVRFLRGSMLLELTMTSITHERNHDTKEERS